MEYKVEEGNDIYPIVPDQYTQLLQYNETYLNSHGLDNQQVLDALMKERFSHFSRRKRGAYSKNGCVSCKKMKLKCDEQQPECRRCVRAGRECVYPSMTQQLQREQKFAAPTKHLDITIFEYQLFKFYLEWNFSFFGAHNNDLWRHFWGIEVPRKFTHNQLIKATVYSMSCIKLWRFYQHDETQDIYVMCDGMEINLMEQTDRLFDNLLSMIAKVDCNANMTIDDCAAFLLANGIVYSVTCLHPKPPFKLLNLVPQDPSNFDLLSMLNSLYIFSPVIREKLEKTMYSVVYAQKTIDSESEVGIKVIEILKTMKMPPLDYITMYTTANAAGPEELSHYMNIIMRIRKTVAVCFAMGHYLPLNVLLPQSFVWSRGESESYFYKRLKEGDYLARKILFYICVLASYGRFKIYRNSFKGIWDTYQEDYIESYGMIDPHDQYIFDMRFFGLPDDETGNWLRLHGSIDSMRTDALNS